jgi:hypothetical protein
MRDDLASNSSVRDSAKLRAVPFEVIRSTSARLAPLRLSHRRKAQFRPNAEGEAQATLASATFQAALVNWPLAERCDVTLECCTEALAADVGVGVLPQVRAVISAVIAMVVNSSVGGSVVTCAARVIEGDAVVSMVTTHCTASMLDVGRAMALMQDETVQGPTGVRVRARPVARKPVGAIVRSQDRLRSAKEWQYRLPDLAGPGVHAWHRAMTGRVDRALRKSVKGE